MRFDLEIIASWIEPRTRVLDLGCGEGDLLCYLKNAKQIFCTGIDQEEKNIEKCIMKGLSALHGDINKEVSDYADQSFDYIILSQTLQQVYEPQKLITSLLRIGKKVVVSFPNFSHWTCRWQLLTRGRAPHTNQLPYAWYDTPNIRIVTLKDFRIFAKESGFGILKEVPTNIDPLTQKGRVVSFLPNLRATYGIYLLGNT